MYNMQAIEIIPTVVIYTHCGDIPTVVIYHDAHTSLSLLTSCAAFLFKHKSQYMTHNILVLVEFVRRTLGKTS